MKRFELTVARIEEPDGMPLMFVQVPWRYFSHFLGPTTFESVVSRAMLLSTVKYLPISVSQSPAGEWKCDPVLEHHWKRILATTKAEELDWHIMKVEASESPFEEMDLKLKIFPYGEG
jgi:hypothetical protein